MPDAVSPIPQIKFLMNGRKAGDSLPASLLAATRGGAACPDTFLPPGYLVSLASFDVSPAARSAVAGVGSGGHEFVANPDDLVVFELADGGTLITSAVRLRDSLALCNPEFLSDTQQVLIEKLRADSSTPDRALGPALNGVISKIHFLRVGPDDDIIGAVLKHVSDAEWAQRGASHLVTIRLVKEIERRIGRSLGLHRWDEKVTQDAAQLEACQLVDKLGNAAEDIDGKPLLVFVHGTASSTVGSFGDLRLDSGIWTALKARFGKHIYGFEHRTLSKSPIDNAFELASALPRNAQVCLVSHSRGGLVCDLLCLDQFDDLTKVYGANSPQGGEDQNAIWHDAQRDKLARLGALLRARKLEIRRYVRVASPANGTLLAAGNFDVFLSGLLTLIGAVPFFYGNPIYSAFKRLLIEVARNRIDPHLVPGFEAMLPDSPLAQLLRRAPVRKGLEMAVIAGDADSGNMLSRLGVMLTDFLLFDMEDNDRIVNTSAMLAGIAAKAGARVLFDRGANVSHFRYFTNANTRVALRDWLTASDLAPLKLFSPLPSPAGRSSVVQSATRSLGGATLARPVVVVIPGVLGSHLGVNKSDRLWLDPVEIGLHGLARIRMEEPGVDGMDLFELSYGPLCKRLDQTHRVVVFPYDWRQSLETLGGRLGQFLGDQLRLSQGPVRLLAHGMGGLLVRACRHTHPRILEELMEREGARLVMLGTPNHGTHAAVQNLIGKGDALRAIARLVPVPADGAAIDVVLDAFAGFPGVLSLLPAPGFKELYQDQGAGDKPLDFYSANTWITLREIATDKWFGDRHSAVPNSSVLAQAAWLWNKDAGSTPSLPSQDARKTIYVHGVARNTTCGIHEEVLPSFGAGAVPPRNRLRMVGTAMGDGLVTWEAGRSAGIGHYYFMPVQHGDLLSTEDYFPALAELLTTGSTTLLSQQAPAARTTERLIPLRYDAGPPIILDDDALQRGLMGGSLRNRIPAQTRRRLAVQVKAVDVRFVSRPIMVGHYEQDPIAGVEAVIDRELLRGDLSKRYGLGLYAGPRGSTTVVLRGATERAQPRAHLTGAVVVGLGRFEDALSAADLTEAVHTSALRYLLHIVDILGKEEREVELASLLLGFNSSASIPASASVEALVRGVMQANARLYEMTGLNIRISSLDIIEVYLDTAISAVYALRQLAEQLAGQAERQGMTLVPNKQLAMGEGMRQRLINDRFAGYWPRLVVTDADRDDGMAASTVDAGKNPLATRLRFMFIGPRARAEVVVQQRQPALVESLVRQQIGKPIWDRKFGHMLFQLMVPHDFKDAARQLDRLVLVVDSHTANLPWELMLGSHDGDLHADAKPLALRAAMVRQLSSTRFRGQVVRTVARHALVIGNPSIDGYATAFKTEGITRDMGMMPPAFLQGAVNEANAVASTLRKLNYDVTTVIGDAGSHAKAGAPGYATAGAPGNPTAGAAGNATADAVLSALYRKPWRILHISAHGVYDRLHRDGAVRSGVLLSDGLLITAAEVAAMEVVPELVFLNCCHLGQIDGGDNRNKLAGSIARELIDIGVRCVLVAGWAVSDTQARIFGETFYKEILIRRRAFGDAVLRARETTYEQDVNDITWGAFQAYGDPGWMAEPMGEDLADKPDEHYAALDEVLDDLERARVRLSHQRDSIEHFDARTVADEVRAMVRRSPTAWLDLPALHSALGTIRFELHDLEQAREDYLRAICLEDAAGLVPICDIERLVKVEALLAEQLAEHAAASYSKEATPRAGQEKAIRDPMARAEELIRKALARLDGLNKLSTGVDSSRFTNGRRDEVNGVRSALTGLVWKSMAGLRARKLGCGLANGKALATRDAMLYCLRRAAKAYGQAAGMPDSAHFSPDLALTQLILESLSRPKAGSSYDAAKRDEKVALARHCSQRADQEPAEGALRLKALIHPKAQLAEHLIMRNLGRRLAGDVIIEEIAQAYIDAFGKIALKPSELDDVVTEIEAAARFCLALLPDEPAAHSTGALSPEELAERSCAPPPDGLADPSCVAPPEQADDEMLNTGRRLILLSRRLQPQRLLPGATVEPAPEDPR